MKQTSTLVVLSGGMDSATLAHLAASNGPIVTFSVDYGQRHGERELACAEKIARQLGAAHLIAQMGWLGPMIAGKSALLNGSIAVPTAEYNADSMASTVVANRNAVIGNLAAAVAIARGLNRVWLGVHGGDHHLYPDCRPGFVSALDHLVNVGNEGGLPECWDGVEAPFVNMTKADIAKIGDGLGVDWTQTWSCYNEREHHCGACGTCVERRAAFAEARLDDPTKYESQGE